MADLVRDHQEVWVKPVDGEAMPARRSERPRLLAAWRCALLVVAAVPLLGADDAGDDNAWRLMAKQDLRDIQDTLATKYIYAVYSAGMNWPNLSARAAARAAVDLPKVRSFGGYRAVIQHYFATFEDPHLHANFALQPRKLQWPGILARYDGHAYRITVSDDATVTAGSILTACDGVAIQKIINARAVYQGGTIGLGSTNDAIAQRLFQDEDNPLLERPRRCTFGGVERTLPWTTVAADRIAVLTAPSSFMADQRASITSFGHDNAWVRLPIFQPPEADWANYNQVIASLPSLRAKRVIVFDVRGNGGGNYNWFIGAMRSLWGAPYVSYYARERLKIENVMLGDVRAAMATPDDPRMPPDPDMDQATAKGVRIESVGAGQVVTLMGRLPAAQLAHPTGPSPPDPVKATVYVLTDYGCGSSCIGFVDEMVHLPGVRQIGQETYVDRLSGSPVGYKVPSGAAELRVPDMVRIDRPRGDNVPRRPSATFGGDIDNTAAVQRWVLSLAGN